MSMDLSMHVLRWLLLTAHLWAVSGSLASYSLFRHLHGVEVGKQHTVQITDSALGNT